MPSGTSRTLAAVLASLAAAAVLADGGSAAAAGHTCSQVDPEVIGIDASIDEWKGLRAFRAGPVDDGELRLRCAYDPSNLYLLVEVIDDKVVRTRQARARGEDSVTVSLAASSAARPIELRIFPGSPTGPRKVIGVPKGGRAEDTLTETGYAVEVAVPLARLAGYGRSTPVLLATIQAHDADRPAAGAIDDVATFTGRLHFASHLPAYRGFLKATRLAARDLRLDQLVDVDAAPGTERVVWGGRFVGVLTDGFGFVEIPATSNADVLEVKLVDPSASGRPMILTHSRQRGQNGARELVMLWRLDGSGQFARVLGVEVMQELDGKTIHNTWALVPAGTARARKAKPRPRRGAMDLLVQVGDVAGWDAEAYQHVAPSTDVQPVMTPWGGTPAVVYAFDGDAVIGPEPAIVKAAKTAKKKRR